MNREEKIDRLNEYCSSVYCNVCKLIGYDDCYFLGTEQKLDEMLSVIGVNTTDNVNHPNHYNRPESMECIKEMTKVFGLEAVKNFCLCNVWKYRYRAADKNGSEDLNKSDWYMKKYVELCGDKNE